MLSLKSFSFSLLFILSLAFTLYAQDDFESFDFQHRIVFYNVENYFDPFIDSTTSYNEFTAEEERHWNYSRYKSKRSRLYKVITALGGWNSPSIIGFAEIENRFVLEDLIENTPLKNTNYQIIHHESIDHRGIDVGLIFNADKVEILYEKPIRLIKEDSTEFTTRDILYVKSLIATDTLHLFINHWPSRYGGMLQSAPFRQLAATTVKIITDSICNADSTANILLTGDFNDDPENKSIQILTGSEMGCSLQNLKLSTSNISVKGTLKYQSDWNYFDQIIVSDNMLSHDNSLKIVNNTGHIFDASFLLEEDEKNLGMKPKRTYIGFKYNGGFSDHLPVYLDIYPAKIK